ncbi:IS3 family transposase [Paenibacillus anaericanus]|uniref:IS3 family transposase n=2 Tax=Paenibacillus anaericanus TaxID=170367 RepID=A0A433XSM6_9BACL|nr:IS3 family transposase [Paenibacillus anaericanus]RUT37233.1 IS3 family transposase [Paenibacillus anaericanus]
MGATKGAKNRVSKVSQYELVNQLVSAGYNITLLCEIAKVSRSGYYKWIRRMLTPSSKQLMDEELKEKIMEVHQRLHGIFGYPRIQTWLFKTHGIHVNHKRVYRLMKEMGIKSKIRRKKRFHGKKETYVTSDNILNRDFHASQPNEKWVTDITYIPYNQKNLYLSTIYDLFNNEVISYQISTRNDLQLVIDTVELARGVRKTEGVLLHSDQGYQYTSRLYNKLLTQYKMKVSMSRKGKCLDNACMESFFGHFKAECMYIQSFQSEEALISAIHEYIRFYNYDRFQKKLNNLSPVEYRTKAA